MKKTPCYLIISSGGFQLQIDADELPKVIQGIKSGSPAMVRMGIFNPSFFIGIKLDKKRMREQAILDSPGGYKLQPIKLLEDIFIGVNDKLIDNPK